MSELLRRNGQDRKDKGCRAFSWQKLSHQQIQHSYEYPVWSTTHQEWFASRVARLTASCGFPFLWVNDPEWWEFCAEFVPVMKMHDTPYLFDPIHFSSITHSSKRSLPTLIQDQTILQDDKYIIQLRIATILSRYGTGGNLPFPLWNPSTRTTPLPHPPTSSRLDSRRCLPQICCLQ